MVELKRPTLYSQNTSQRDTNDCGVVVLVRNENEPPESQKQSKDSAKGLEELAHVVPEQRTEEEKELSALPRVKRRLVPGILFNESRVPVVWKMMDLTACRISSENSSEVEDYSPICVPPR